MPEYADVAVVHSEMFDPLLTFLYYKTALVSKTLLTALVDCASLYWHMDSFGKRIACRGSGLRGWINQYFVVLDCSLDFLHYPPLNHWTDFLHFAAAAAAFE